MNNLFPFIILLQFSQSLDILCSLSLCKDILSSAMRMTSHWLILVQSEFQIGLGPAEDHRTSFFYIARDIQCNNEQNLDIKNIMKT